MYGLRHWLRPVIALALLALAAAPGAAAEASDDLYAEAAHHYAQQRYDAAIVGFRRLLADSPKHLQAASAQFFLAESLLQAGKNDEAATAFAEFAEAHPNHRFAAQASFRVSEAAYLQGDYATALPKLQAFVAVHSSSKLCEYALPYLADCQLEQGDAKQAQANYQLALKKFPGGPLSAECRLGLARIAEQNGDLGEARRFYEFLAERGRTSAAVEAKVRLGQLLYQQREFAAAAQYLEPVANATTASSQRTTARYWLGFALLEQDRRSDACKLWTQSITDDDKHVLAPATALALAEALASSGKIDEGRQWCQRIAAEWGDSAYADDALALEVRLALDAKLFDEVTRLTAAFAEKHHDSTLRSTVRVTQGRALLAQGKFAESIEVLEPLAGEDPSAAHVRHALALAQLGAKQFEAALATLEPLDEATTPANLKAAVLATRGSALVALGRGEEAIAPLRKYLAEHATGIDAAKCRAQLCIALAQAKKFDEAQQAWQSYSSKHSTDRTLVPTTLYLADAAAEAGQTAAAHEWYSYLLEADVAPDVRERAVAGLAALTDEKPSANTAATLVPQKSKPQPTSQAAAVALRRAQNLENTGDRENALATYLALLKEHPAAPQTPDALFGAARLHDELAQDREALVLLERLLKEHATYARLDAVHYQTAWVLLDLKRPADAATHFQKVHADHKDSQFWGDATYRLAEHYVQSKRYEEARPLLIALIEAKPNDELLASALYLQGQAATLEQKWPDVAAPLTKLVEKFPQHKLRPLAEYWLAEADYRSGKLQAAGERLADLSTRLEGRTDAWLPLVPLRRAQVLAHEHRWQEAHDLAATISEKHPNFRQQYEVDYLLGRCLGALAKFDASRAAYARVVQSPIGGGTETAAMAQWMIGETFFQQERYDEAIASYHRVERLFAFERWQAAALLQAGKCHEAKGTYRDAIGLYAQLLKQYPQTTFAQEASQRMRVAQQRATTTANR
jgi:TolA-binding protein